MGTRVISLLDQPLFILLLLLSGSCPCSGLKSFVWGALIPMFSSLQCPLCVSQHWTCPQGVTAASSQNSSPLEPPQWGRNPQAHPGEAASLAGVSCGSFLALKGLAGSPCDTSWPVALHPASLIPPAWTTWSNEPVLVSPVGSSPFPRAVSSARGSRQGPALLAGDDLGPALSDPSLQLCGLQRIL